MKQSLVALFCGFLFAIGLGLSSMTQPSKVLSFLDITGSWDPSLIFVMAGAISVYSITFFITKKNPVTQTKVTPSLVIGSALFGIGWGLSGLCPGPMLTSLITFRMQVWVFFMSLLFGIFIYIKLKAAMANMSKSSTSVTVDMGKLNTVPKQAH
jgi:uncharacterized membrane protein YedE/YeeE